MDNIWIFLVIIGAIFSFAQKNQGKRQQGSDEADEGRKGEETVNPHEMLERRVRELLGEETPKSNPMPTHKPARSADTTTSSQQGANRPTLRTSVARPTMTTKQQTAKSAASMPQYRSQTKRTQAIALDVNTIPQKAVSAQTRGHNEQIGQIIDDFSMQKAVIYSEILKPKFEEF
ncbi:MAG: hypothetical protein IKA01_09015 [Alistipes sp.]|nr:hypothetical protein [Alistipes sp.]